MDWASKLQIFQWISENWEILTLLGIGGGYGVKIKVAVNKTKAAVADTEALIVEVKQTHEKVVSALKPDEKGDTWIDEQEAKEIAREVQEDIVALQKAGTSIRDGVESILSIFPAPVRKRLTAWASKA